MSGYSPEVIAVTGRPAFSSPWLTTVRARLRAIDAAEAAHVYSRELEAHRQRVRRDEQAQERACALLLALVCEEERRRYADRHEVIVTGSHGSRYKITHGYQGNVYRLDKRGNIVAGYCAHPRMHTGDGRLPMEDAMITQILAIRADEAEFLRVANVM